MFKIPILVIIFNRPDFTKRMHFIISQVKPQKLYVISDGPRASEETADVFKSREIFNVIDWDCKVKYNYSDSNLGLRERISGGISWAFQTEENLIILEDDCIPHLDFFPFCEQLLNKYKDDERIMTINGCNLNPQLTNYFSEPYFFSRYSNSWGWATWKRAWTLFDSELIGLEDNAVVKNFPYNLPYHSRSGVYWKIILNRVKNYKINSWAYRWMFTLWINNGLAIVPQKNLITNIGNDHRSEHTKGNLFYLNIATANLDLGKTKNPKYIMANSIYDKWLEKKVASQLAWEPPKRRRSI